MRCQIGRVRAREKNESAETDGGRVGPLGGWEDLLVSGGRTAIARSDSLCLLYDPCAPAGRTGRTGLSLRERARLPKDGHQPPAGRDFPPRARRRDERRRGQ